MDEACNFFKPFINIFNSKFSSKYKTNVGTDFIITLDGFIYILIILSNMSNEESVHVRHCSVVIIYLDHVCIMTTLQVFMNHARIVIEKQEVFVNMSRRKRSSYLMTGYGMTNPVYFTIRLNSLLKLCRLYSS